MWAAFWAAPDQSRIGDILADDIVGYWQGDPKPVRGREAYTGKILELIAAWLMDADSSRWHGPGVSVVTGCQGLRLPAATRVGVSSRLGTTGPMTTPPQDWPAHRWPGYERWRGTGPLPIHTQPGWALGLLLHRSGLRREPPRSRNGSVHCIT
jgi:hypothetical protein